MLGSAVQKPRDRIARNVGNVFRTARKQIGLTQAELANRLSMSQGRISKIESGLTSIAAVEWIEFCEALQIPTVSIELGYIDRSSRVSLRDGGIEHGFKIPSRYSNYRASKVRALKIFLDLFSQRFGQFKAREYLEGTGMDPDFFYDYDCQLNLQFTFDVMHQLDREGALDEDSVRRLSKNFYRILSSGATRQVFQGAVAPKDTCHLLVRHLDLLELNSSYRVLDEGKGTLDVSVTPREHVNAFEASDVAKKFLCRYKMEVFSTLTRLATPENQKYLEVVEHECAAGGGDRCVYTVKLN